MRAPLASVIISRERGDRVDITVRDGDTVFVTLALSALEAGELAGELLGVSSGSIEKSESAHRYTQAEQAALMPKRGESLVRDRRRFDSPSYTNRDGG